MNFTSNHDLFARRRRLVHSVLGVTSTEHAVLLGALLAFVLVAAVTIGLRLRGAGTNISSNLPLTTSPCDLRYEEGGPTVETR
jgi:Flp pilus assembly pilin Flp